MLLNNYLMGASVPKALGYDYPRWCCSNKKNMETRYYQKGSITPTQPHGMFKWAHIKGPSKDSLHFTLNLSIPDIGPASEQSFFRHTKR